MMDNLALLLSLSIFGTILLLFWSWKQHNRRFERENETRQRLGLPPLTRSQFRLKVEEKSAEFKKNVNQHM